MVSTNDVMWLSLTLKYVSCMQMMSQHRDRAQMSGKGEITPFSFNALDSILTNFITRRWHSFGSSWRAACDVIRIPSRGRIHIPQSCSNQSQMEGRSVSLSHMFWKKYKQIITRCWTDANPNNIERMHNISPNSYCNNRWCSVHSLKESTLKMYIVNECLP